MTSYETKPELTPAQIDDLNRYLDSGTGTAAAWYALHDIEIIQHVDTHPASAAVGSVALSERAMTAPDANDIVAFGSEPDDMNGIPFVR